MRILKSLTIWLLWGCIFLSGCGSNEYAGAEDLVASHFDRIANEDFSRALDEYAPGFFTKTSREEWEMKLRNMTRNMGNLQRYKVNGATMRKEGSGAGAGIYVSVQCQATYQKCQVQEELIYYKKRPNDDFQILKHRLTSVKEL